MSRAEEQALALRDLAVTVANTKGATTTQAAAPDNPTQYVFEDDRLRNVCKSSSARVTHIAGASRCAKIAHSGG